MGKEEVVSLKWNQVDLYNRLIFLEEIRTREDGALPMNDELYMVFSSQWARQVGRLPLCFPPWPRACQGPPQSMGGGLPKGRMSC